MKGHFCRQKFNSFPFSREYRLGMASYEIFDIWYSNLSHKFEDDNLVFTQKYTVGRQQSCIHRLKDEKNLTLSSALISWFFKQASGKVCLLFAVCSSNASQHFCQPVLEQKWRGSANVQTF